MSYKWQRGGKERGLAFILLGSKDVIQEIDDDDDEHYNRKEGTEARLNIHRGPECMQLSSKNSMGRCNAFISKYGVIIFC